MINMISEGCPTPVMYGRPPSGKGFSAEVGFRSGAVMYPAFVRGTLTAGPEGIRGPGSNHRRALLKRDDRTECPDPGFLTVCRHVAMPLRPVASSLGSRQAACVSGAR